MNAKVSNVQLKSYSAKVLRRGCRMNRHDEAFCLKILNILQTPANRQRAAQTQKGTRNSQVPSSDDAPTCLGTMHLAIQNFRLHEERGTPLRMAFGRVSPSPHALAWLLAGSARTCTLVERVQLCYSKIVQCMY